MNCYIRFDAFCNLLEVPTLIRSGFYDFHLPAFERSATTPVIENPSFLSDFILSRLVVIKVQALSIIKTQYSSIMPVLNFPSETWFLRPILNIWQGYLCEYFERYLHFCLYRSGLCRAIDFNPRLSPHILQFLEWHFQSYFTVNELNFEIHFDRVLPDRNDNEIWDHLGKLIHLMGHCVVACKKHELNHDTKSVETLLDSLMHRIDIVTMEQLGVVRLSTNQRIQK